MPQYADALTLREARQAYFARHGLGDGGYDAALVKLQAGPIPIYFPNTKARVRAVRLHDLHHVLTEYDTTWRGEAAIGAWEIASGCGRHYPAWILNILAVAIGLAIAPGAVRRAFLRGCHSANLYATRSPEALLDRTVGELRRTLRLDRAPALPTPKDHVRFVAWAALSLLAAAGPIAVVLTLGLAGLRRRLG